jgi:hypothetical protein
MGSSEDAFRQAMGELGYVEGETLLLTAAAIASRSAELKGV